MRRLDEARRHARDLAPAVAELLSAQGWKPHELDAVIVSRGPGSFTGLRVGLISAQALAYAAGCAVLAIDTFAAIARQAPADASTLAVLADAQQEQVYVQWFARADEGSNWQAVTGLEVQSLDEFRARCGKETWVTGPGLHRYRSQLPSEVSVVEGEAWEPKPESVLEIGLARYRRGERDDLWKLEPLYARPSAAEQQWQARH
jgi:tRNA threonylcarbamoyladenosine biosynthesis protein TsaB